LALLGTSHNTKAVESIVKLIFREYKTKAPKFKDIKDKVTKDETKGVEFLTRVSTACANLSGIVVPPPFPTETILRFAGIVEEEELDPIELVEKVLAAARDFDTKQEDNVDYNKGGLEKSKQLVRWLLSVYHSFIKN
jgi:hypothetical protein